MHGRYLLVFILLSFSFEFAFSKESAICLPIGDKKLAQFRLDDTTLVRDLILGNAKFPAGCVIDVWYGPELGGSVTAAELLKTRIIRSARCKKGIKIGRFQLLNASFDGDFCLHGRLTLATAAKACEVPFEKGESVPFVAGLPECGEIIPGSTPTPPRRAGFD